MLPAADRHHRVDGLQPGLDRLGDRLTLDHAGCHLLDRRRLRGVDAALAIHRHAQRVHDPAEQRLADRHLEDAAGRLDGVAFRDVLVVTQHHGADRILLQIQRQAEGVAGELQHLAVGRLAESVDADDAVGDGDDGPDVTRFGGGLELLDLLLDEIADLGCLD